MLGTIGWEDATKGEDMGNLWLIVRLVVRLIVRPIVRLIVVNWYYLWIPNAGFDLPSFCLLRYSQTSNQSKQVKIWHDLTILIAGQPSEQAASHQFLLHGFSDGSRYKSLTGGEQHEPSRIPWSVPAASSRSASQWNWRRGGKGLLLLSQKTQMAIWLEKNINYL